MRDRETERRRQAPATEAEAADTLLERDVEVTIAGRRYTARPATFATLLEVGAVTATLPAERLTAAFADATSDRPRHVIGSLLETAPEIAKVSRILATLIVGAEPPGAGLRGWRNRRRRRRLERRFARELTPGDAYAAIVRLTELLRVDRFFLLTAFLLQMTGIGGEAVRETTPGASSRG